MTQDQAEMDRLRRALATGPARRIAQDQARGLPAQRADLDQARRYEGRLAWLEAKMAAGMYQA